ncbi:hypothetical protein I2I05_20515 [Hymenobacter sp. BT683]|uniref:Uncharacterized protein n=1 Tax=Hymenobacter jeongseonensis TaxID=2791027 RepID=A0ABS0IN37_9BACT|nr:hypothetical protein [Hymenobacter jeongseonensis]MBF9239789.1 hypothetical protein [Hymenobacter jeongseonensis]
MRLYVVYLLAAFLSVWLVLFYRGLSAGLVNPLPLIAFVGGVLLSAGAAPVLVYRARAGLWLGTLGYVLLLPYSAVLWAYVLVDWKGHWLSPVVLLPGVLVLVSSYATARSLHRPSTYWLRFPAAAWGKRGLALLPLLLWGSYCLSTWAFWL